jgi:hypothetical protein
VSFTVASDRAQVPNRVPDQGDGSLAVDPATSPYLYRRQWERRASSQNRGLRITLTPPLKRTAPTVPEERATAFEHHRKWSSLPDLACSGTTWRITCHGGQRTPTGAVVRTLEHDGNVDSNGPGRDFRVGPPAKKP